MDQHDIKQELINYTREADLRMVPQWLKDAIKSWVEAVELNQDEFTFYNENKEKIAIRTDYLSLDQLLEQNESYDKFRDWFNRQKQSLFEVTKKIFSLDLRNHWTKSSPIFLYAIIAVPSRPPDITVKGFHMEEARNNKKYVEIKGPHGEFFKEEQIVRITSPETSYYQPDGNPLIISASEALSKLDTNDMLFKGATNILSADGFKIVGQNIQYRHVDSKILTDEPIEFESTADFKQAVIKGSGLGFEADIKTKTFTLSSNVEMTFSPKDQKGPPSRIKSNSMRVFLERGWAQLEGNVAFQNQNLNLRSDILSISFSTKNNATADEAIFQSVEGSRVISLFDNYKMSSREVILGLKNRQDIAKVVAKRNVVLADNKGLVMNTDLIEIENPQGTQRRMKLSGNVFIKRGSDEARCREATFDPATDELVLKGDASYKRGTDVLAGEEIRYIQSKGILQIKRASGQINRNRMNIKR